MHQATPDEIEKISNYVESQAPKLKVTFAQKMHVENLYGHTHETWDVQPEETVLGDHESDEPL